MEDRPLLEAIRLARSRVGTGPFNVRLREALVEQGLAVELMQEQASSLGRVGRQLSVACATLVELDRQMRHASPPERYSDAKRDTRRLYSEIMKAKAARFKLIVQREAIGLRNHDSIDDIYVSPFPLDQTWTEERVAGVVARLQNAHAR